MKILVGNNTLGRPGGSETYTYAIIKELISKGHDVDAIGVNGGMISNKLKELGVKCYFKPIAKEYDLILLSHGSAINMAKNCKGFKVQTCHGIYPKLEQPVKGMDAYVSISKEVKNHLSVKGFNSTIIENGVDCERFKSKKPINIKLKSVLSLCQGATANNMIKQVCQELGITFIKNDRMKAPVFNIEDIINRVDLVISLGRGCYESMACGRNVLIFDSRKYVGEKAIGDGMLIKNDIKYFLQNNCSGRFVRKQFNKEQLKNELTSYSQQNGEDLREFVIKELNIKKQVNKYLDINKIR